MSNRERTSGAAARRIPERFVLTAAWLALLAAPAVAADPGRLDLLATEIAGLVSAPGPASAGTMSAWAVAALVGGTMLAALLGTWMGSGGGPRRGGGDWRELTFRFPAGRPLRLSQDTLARLNDLLNGAEEPAPGPAARNGGTKGPPDALRPDLRNAYARVRRLLEEGGEEASAGGEPGGPEPAQPDPPRTAPTGNAR